MKTVIGYAGNAKRVDLVGILKHHIARVTFTKVNGEDRVMKCTLMRSVLPEGVTNNGRGWHTAITGTLSVWDVEKEDWRAFRVSSVKEIEFAERPHSFM